VRFDAEAARARPAQRCERVADSDADVDAAELAIFFS
jgi:hypothetical protein